MSTAGQKRKLKDTDIPPTDNETPLIKQQKLTPNDPSQESTSNNTLNEPNTPNTNNTKIKNETPKLELESKSKDELKTDNNNTTDNKEEENDDNDDDILDNETFSKIQIQLEYYFGDSNLPLDNHILEVSNYEINKGYYPISGLLTFSKIQLLTQNINNLIKVIKSSLKLQLNDTETGVRRHPSLGNPPTKDEIYSRTIFAKGFHPRCQLNDLINFWQTNVSNNENILSVRTIKETFSVGISENNKPKIIKRFLGNCFVELNTIDLANKFSKMIFKHNGNIIRCGMYKSYWNDNIKWKIKKKLLPFESNKIILIRDIPTYSTWSDIKCWISNGLYKKIKKKNSKNKCEYVGKNMNDGFAYARFSKESNINECVELIKKKSLMGLYPKINILNDEQAKKIWENVAEMKWNVNKDVEIIIEKKNNDDEKNDKKIKCEKKKDKDDGNNGKEENEDVDIVGIKEEGKSDENNDDNNKKHKLEDSESTQPTKKQKTC